MRKKAIEKNLSKALLEDGPLVKALFEFELEEHLEEYLQSKREDHDKYFFAVTEHSNDVAMLLIDESDKVHVNRSARTLLKKLWRTNYRHNMQVLIPAMASTLDAGHLFSAGVKLTEGIQSTPAVSIGKETQPPKAVANRTSPHQKSATGYNLYTLEVFIITGPITRKFVKKNPVISRTIEIRGDQTLEDLHLAIFEAFGRQDNHMYEFQIGGKGPDDPRAKRYGLSTLFEDSLEPTELAGDVAQTTLEALKLKIDQMFGYWFDFGDDWRHQINVLSIGRRAGKGKYPKVIKRIGQSPPQYTELDE